MRFIVAFCLNPVSNALPPHPTEHQSTEKQVTFAVFGCHNYPQPPLWSAIGWNIAAVGARPPTAAISSKCNDLSDLSLLIPREHVYLLNSGK